MSLLASLAGSHIDASGLLLLAGLIPLGIIVWLGSLEFTLVIQGGGPRESNVQLGGPFIKCLWFEVVTWGSRLGLHLWYIDSQLLHYCISAILCTCQAYRGLFGFCLKLCTIIPFGIMRSVRISLVELNFYFCYNHVLSLNSALTFVRVQILYFLIVFSFLTWSPYDAY